MGRYETLIPENAAILGARRIGIYNHKGNRVGYIPLGRLALPGGKKQYSFGALADIHLQYDTAQTDFERALRYLNGEEDVEFVCVAGDLTSQGTTEELTGYKNAVAAYAGGTPVYAVTGNHDVLSGNQDSIGTYTGNPLCYTFSRGEDLFIMLGISGAEEGALFTAGQLQWLYETLEANRNRRCFLFHHVRPQDGCGNALGIYDFDIWGGTEAAVFESLMNHYKNVHQFHGHSHLKFYLQYGSDEANIDHRFGGWSVHIPSLAVPRDGDVTGAGSRKDIYADSEGYVVDVYGQGIHLRGRDFVKGEFLPVASYWLDTAIEEVEAETYWDDTGTVITHQQIPYIETADAQYIDTGILPDSNTRVELDFLSAGTTWNDIMGSRNTTSKNAFAFSTTATAWRFGYYSSYATDTAFDGLRHTVDINKNVLTLDGTVIYTAPEKTFTGIYPICLGAIKASSMYLGHVRLYSCRIYDNGTLVRDMVPCLNAKGEPGMYDSVDHKFYGNAGSGTFITGTQP